MKLLYAQRRRRNMARKYRKKQQRSQNENINITPPTPASPSPGWADLLPELLPNILNRILPSLPDLLAFSLVCTSWQTSWRSFAADTLCLPTVGPPLLLSSSRPQRPRRSTMNRILTVTPYPRPLRSMLSFKARNATCIGCSYGRIICTAGRVALIADVFTGMEIPSPQLPFAPSPHMVAILTEPPTSSSSKLILVSWDAARTQVHYWQVLDNPHRRCWSTYTITIQEPKVYSVVAFQDKIYMLLSDAQVLVFADNQFKLLEGSRLPNGSEGLLHLNYGQSLVACNGHLLLLRFVADHQHHRGNKKTRIEIWQFDLVNQMWLAVENIGDWSLFVDGTGRCTQAFSKPLTWGGKRNSVCITAPDFRSWTVLPLDGSSFDAALVPFLKWPFPVWVAYSQYVIP